MKYEVKMIRRVSKNSGRNVCKYAVIVESESQKIVRDVNLRYDRPEHLAEAEATCKEINEVGDYDKWFEMLVAKMHEMYLERKGAEA